MAQTIFYSNNTTIDIEKLKNELETCSSPGPYVVVKITPGPQGVETRTVVVVDGTIIDPSPEYTQIQDLIDNHVSSKDPETTRITSGVKVSEDLQVDGTQTIFNTDTVTIEDNLIQVNSDATSPQAVISGVEINRGSGYDSALISFDERTSPGKFKVGLGESGLSELLTASNFSSVITGITRNQISAGTANNILFNDSATGLISESSEFLWLNGAKELRLQNSGVPFVYFNPSTSTLINSSVISLQSPSILPECNIFSIYATGQVNPKFKIDTSSTNDYFAFRNKAGTADKLVINTGGTNDSIQLKSDTISLLTTAGSSKIVYQKSLEDAMEPGIVISGDILMNSRSITFLSGAFGVWGKTGSTYYPVLTFTSTNTNLNAYTGKQINFSINDSIQWSINSSGNLLPIANKDLASSGTKVNNAYITNAYVTSLGSSGSYVTNGYIINAYVTSLGSAGSYVTNGYITNGYITTADIATADIDYLVGGIIIYNASTYLRSASDAMVLQLCGGSNGATGNGAYINLYGNSANGVVQIIAGNNTNSYAQIRAADNPYGEIYLDYGSNSGLYIRPGGSSGWLIDSTGNFYNESDCLICNTSFLGIRKYLNDVITVSEAGKVQMNGGSDFGTEHGAWVTCYGNDNTSGFGNLMLSAGNSAVGGYGRVYLGTSGGNRWFVENTGHFYPMTNAYYDIGYSTLAVRDVYSVQFDVVGVDGDGEDGIWQLRQSKTDGIEGLEFWYKGPATGNVWNGIARLTTSGGLNPI